MMEIGKETNQLDMENIKDKVKFIRECLFRAYRMAKVRRRMRMVLVIKGILLKA